MAGQIKDVTDPLGNKTSYSYDLVGRVTSVVDALGNAAGGVPAEHTTTYAYDKEDRLRFVTLPAPVVGQPALVGETRYNEMGKPTVKIDANGQVTTYAYDERNSLLQVKESPSVWTNPTGPPSGVITTEYSHDAGGNTTRVTRARGDGTYERATDYAYDGRGLARSETQYPAWPSAAESLISTASFDFTGNPLTSVDPLGQTTNYTHDALNRVTGIDYTDARTPDVTYLYDAQGSRTLMTDGTGATTYAHDEAERLTSVTSPGPKRVEYRYDLDGNRTKLIYPDATAVSYTFNKASQLASLQDWASRSVVYAYWPDGKVKTATNPNASIATYTYDNARRLIEIAHTKPGSQIDRFYYNLDGVGNVTSLSNGSFFGQHAPVDGFVSSNGTWAGTYASIGEWPPDASTYLASPTNPTTPNYYEVTLADVAPPNNPNGSEPTYLYAKSGNNQGKTINLTVELRQGATVIASQTHSNIPGESGSGWQQGRLTLTPAQAALVTNWADLRLRFVPTSSGGGQGRQAQIGWAEMFAPAPGNPATQLTYTYDRLNRLTGVSGPDGPRSYTYDPAGNRLTKVAGASTAYSYDRADRILTAGPTALTVDANGNLVAKGADTFAFDQANRMTTATVAGAAETYAYDGDGTRFSRQLGAGPAIRYVSDLARGLPTTIDDGTRKYVYGLGLAYAVSGSSIEVYHTDRLGSVRALTDGSGNIIATYRSDEWGIPTASTGSSSQPLSFTGEPRDATGLSYLRARYYDPNLGRLTSQDTWTGSMATSVSQNRYAYANNNPTTLTDPSGHCVVDTFADAAFILYDVLTLAFGAEKDQALNAAALAADAAFLLVPCGTGAGFAVRYGDEAFQWLDHGARLACSFTPETLVATPSGRVPIPSIEVGDIVLAWDETTGETVERTVTAVLPHPDDEIARVTIDGQVVTTTPDHPFYTIDSGWVEAGLLWPGARVRTTGGSSAVGSIEIRQFEGILWDLTVQGAHTFFVGSDEVLVHNCAAPVKTPWGWSGSQAFRDRVRVVDAGGDILQVGRIVPTRAEAELLIESGGGTVLRVEGPHLSPNPHQFPHINYTTSSGTRGTIRITDLG